ncbi:UNVERIFIED_CONTAM: hypothetical protein HDU68_002212 [Siphonaria sp. JEL0065]|nr:hypothetical protein HDU68_002212 [Siphonaria sp. JEL0065]
MGRRTKEPAIAVHRVVKIEGDAATVSEVKQQVRVAGVDVFEFEEPPSRQHHTRLSANSNSNATRPARKPKATTTANITTTVPAASTPHAPALASTPVPIRSSNSSNSSNVNSAAQSPSSMSHSLHHKPHQQLLNQQQHPSSRKVSRFVHGQVNVRTVDEHFGIERNEEIKKKVFDGELSDVDLRSSPEKQQLPKKKGKPGKWCCFKSSCCESFSSKLLLFNHMRDECFATTAVHKFYCTQCTTQSKTMNAFFNHAKSHPELLCYMATSSSSASSVKSSSSSASDSAVPIDLPDDLSGCLDGESATVSSAIPISSSSTQLVEQSFVAYGRIPGNFDTPHGDFQKSHQQQHYQQPFSIPDAFYPSSALGSSNSFYGTPSGFSTTVPTRNNASPINSRPIDIPDDTPAASLLLPSSLVATADSCVSAQNEMLFNSDPEISTSVLGHENGHEIGGGSYTHNSAFDDLERENEFIGFDHDSHICSSPPLQASTLPTSIPQVTVPLPSSPLSLLNNQSHGIHGFQHQQHLLQNPLISPRPPATATKVTNNPVPNPTRVVAKPITAATTATAATSSPTSSITNTTHSSKNNTSSKSINNYNDADIILPYNQKRKGSLSSRNSFGCGIEARGDSQSAGVADGDDSNPKRQKKSRAAVAEPAVVKKEVGIGSVPESPVRQVVVQKVVMRSPEVVVEVKQELPAPTTLIVPVAAPLAMLPVVGTHKVTTSHLSPGIIRNSSSGSNGGGSNSSSKKKRRKHGHDLQTHNTESVSVVIESSIPFVSPPPPPPSPPPASMTMPIDPPDDQDMFFDAPDPPAETNDQEPPPSQTDENNAAIDQIPSMVVEGIGRELDDKADDVGEDPDDELEKSGSDEMHNHQSDVSRDRGFIHFGAGGNGGGVDSEKEEEEREEGRGGVVAEFGGSGGLSAEMDHRMAVGTEPQQKTVGGGKGVDYSIGHASPTPDVVSSAHLGNGVEHLPGMEAEEDEEAISSVVDLRAVNLEYEDSSPTHVTAGAVAGSRGEGLFGGGVADTVVDESETAVDALCEDAFQWEQYHQQYPLVDLPDDTLQQDHQYQQQHHTQELDDAGDDSIVDFGDESMFSIVITGDSSNVNQLSGHFQSRQHDELEEEKNDQPVFESHRWLDDLKLRQDGEREERHCETDEHQQLQHHQQQEQQSQLHHRHHHNQDGDALSEYSNVDETDRHPRMDQNISMADEVMEEGDVCATQVENEDAMEGVQQESVSHAQRYDKDHERQETLHRETDPSVTTATAATATATKKSETLPASGEFACPICQSVLANAAVFKRHINEVCFRDDFRPVPVAPIVIKLPARRVTTTFRPYVPIDDPSQEYACHFCGGVHEESCRVGGAVKDGTIQRMLDSLTTCRKCKKTVFEWGECALECEKDPEVVILTRLRMQWLKGVLAKNC